MSSFFNKQVIRGVLAPFLFVTCLLTPAHATSFNFSYEFDNGFSIEGMFEAERRTTPGQTQISDILTGMGTAKDSSGEIIATFDLINFGLFTDDLQAVRFSMQDSTQPGNRVPIDRSAGGARVIINNLTLASDIPLNGDRLIIEEKNAPIPEPASLILFGTGMLGLLAWARRKKTSGTS